MIELLKEMPTWARFLTASTTFLACSIAVVMVDGPWLVAVGLWALCMMSFWMSVAS